MSKLLILVGALALAPILHAQTATYTKGEIVRLVAPASGDPLPDSRVIATPGDRILANKSGISVNGEAVTGISPKVLEQFAEPWDQTVPPGHYFVVGERRDSVDSIVMYQGLIPAAKIAQRVGRKL